MAPSLVYSTYMESALPSVSSDSPQSTKLGIDCVPAAPRSRRGTPTELAPNLAPKCSSEAPPRS